jgi:hypothetical protein
MLEKRNLVLEKVDLILTEIAEIRLRGPHFRIFHRFHSSHLRTACAPGEEVFAVCLIHLGREYFLPLSLSLRILFDYLARHSRFPQSAAQIEAGIRNDPFSMQHAHNALAQVRFTRSFPRSFVRIYVERLRRALEQAFREAGVLTESYAILRSEKTVMNEVGYRLIAHADWVHTTL